MVLEGNSFHFVFLLPLPLGVVLPVPASPLTIFLSPKGRSSEAQANEGVKNSTLVILGEAKELSSLLRFNDLRTTAEILRSG